MRFVTVYNTTDQAFASGDGRVLAGGTWGSVERDDPARAARDRGELVFLTSLPDGSVADDPREAFERTDELNRRADELGEWTKDELRRLADAAELAHVDDETDVVELRRRLVWSDAELVKVPDADAEPSSVAAATDDASEPELVELGAEPAPVPAPATPTPRKRSAR